MPITPRRGAAGLGLAALAVALGACTHAPTKPTVTSTTRVPGTSTTSTGVSSTSSTTTSAPEASLTTCLPSQLQIAIAGSEGSAGTTELTFSLMNSSSQPCTMFGYPGMLLLTTGGVGLPTVVTRGGGLSFESISPANITLDPGQAAYFNLGYNDVTQGTTTCSSATQVGITPPNDTSYVVTSVPQILACGGGALNVSPVFPSTDAPATSTTAPPSP